MQRQDRGRRLRLILTLALFAALAAAPLHVHDLRGAVLPELVQIDDGLSPALCSACRFRNETVELPATNELAALCCEQFESVAPAGQLVPVSLPLRSGRAPPLV